MIRLLVFLLLLSSSVLADDPPRYWVVAGSTTQVWSLNTNSAVSVGDSDYTVWLAAGNHVSRIASVSELYDVISQGYPAHLAASAPNLEAIGTLLPYQAFSWRRAAGYTITYTGYPTLDGRYAVDDPWYGGLTNGALLRCSTTPLDVCTIPFPHNLTTVTYIDMDGGSHEMSIVQLQVIVLAIQDHIADLYTQLAVGLHYGTPVWPSLSTTVP